jgi:hypothetical protein
MTGNSWKQKLAQDRFAPVAFIAHMMQSTRGKTQKPVQNLLQDAQAHFG